MRVLGIVVAVGACLGVAGTIGVSRLVAEEHDEDLPPCVVSCEPANRNTSVDFRIRKINVTFDRPMETGRNWSWIIHKRLGLYPGHASLGDPRWENGGRTCVLPVRLSPDTLYAIGVNSFRHTGFHDAGGRPAVPFVWVFKTEKAD